MLEMRDERLDQREIGAAEPAMAGALVDIFAAIRTIQQSTFIAPRPLKAAARIFAAALIS
jgi:hypothetical protein